MNGLRIGANGLLSTLFTRRVPLVGRRALLHSNELHAAAQVPKIRPQLRRPPCSPRSLHTTAPRQAYWFLLTPLARFAVAVGARVGRRWWKRQPSEWRKGVWAHMSARKRYILGGVAACSLGGVVYYWVHLEDTPITHRRRFVMFTREQVASLIEEEKDVIRTMISGGVSELSPDHEMYRHVALIAMRIITRNELAEEKGFKWNVHVIDDPRIVNAICLPSGDIFVFTGLVKACQNKEELALIMSHEIAHAVLGHGLEVLSSRAVVDFFSLFVVGLIWTVVPYAVASVFLHSLSRKTADILIHFPYSRKLETEADAVGLTMAARACYNPATSIKVWEHLTTPSSDIDTAFPMGSTADYGAPQGSTADGAPQGSTPVEVTRDQDDEFYSTHPSNIHRYENLVQLLPEAELEYIAACSQYGR
ncbi:hypothetical protein EMCRGX_G018791 [Ephydatia muelleri]